MKKTYLAILLAVVMVLSIPLAAFAATATPPTVTGTYDDTDEMWYPTFLVWYDVNKDGTQGEGEMTLSDITIIAIDKATGQEVGQATSIMGASYFNELPAGEYIFRIILPEGMDYYTASVKNSFGSSMHAERMGKCIVEFEYTASPYEQTQFLIGVYSLGDSYFSGYVWNDVDGDGVRPDFDGWSGGSNTEGENETGVSGAVVTAVNTQNSRQTYTATTNEVGFYEFSALPAGEYTFTVEIPGQTNVTFTTPVGGTATVEVTEPDGQSLDFGLGRPGTVPPVTQAPDPVATQTPSGTPTQNPSATPTQRPNGDQPKLYGFVWWDANQNKLRPGYNDPDDPNGAEEGIEGAIVTAYDSQGLPVASATTQELGQYEMYLPEGRYTISVSLPKDITNFIYTTPKGGETVLPLLKPTDYEQNFGVAQGPGGTAATEVPEPTVTLPPAVYTTPEPGDTPTLIPGGTPGTGAKLNTEDHYAYIVGYEDGTIRPQNKITRQEVATIFFRLLTDESRNIYKATENPFSDVSAGLWSNMAISTMTNAMVLKGYEDGTFRPANNITRAEFATIAAKFDSHSYVGPDKFSDISGHWANEYINRAAAMGWINGYEDGTFRPDAYITRAEAMTLVNNVLNRHVLPEGMTSDVKVWPDNDPSMWYYAAIEEATNSHEYKERAADEKNETWTTLRENRDWAALEK